MSWDDHSGHWQGLDQDVQIPRYALIAALLSGRKRVLDVGCGEAILARWLPGADYTGVEPSAEAIKGANGARVIHSTAEDFNPHHVYDALVFNESIYYLRDPAAVVYRLAGHLEPDGLLLCSVYQKPATWRGRSRNVIAEAEVRRELRGWRMVADCFVGHRDSVRWNVWCATR